MNTKDILYHLRTERGLSQDELAAKIFVTRQAVSRWETGETTPNVETLKLLSAFFNVSINTPVSYTHLDVYKRQIMLLLLSYCSVFKVQNCENSFAAKPQVKFSLLTFLFTRK